MFKKQKKIDKLNTELATLKHTKDRYKKEALHYEYDKIILESRLMKLEADHNKLTVAHEELLVTAGDLGKKTQSLIEEYYQLKKENKALDWYKNEVERLSQVNHDMDNKLYEMKCELSWYKISKESSDRK